MLKKNLFFNCCVSTKKAFTLVGLVISFCCCLGKSQTAWAWQTGLACHKGWACHTRLACHTGWACRTDPYFLWLSYHLTSYSFKVYEDLYRFKREFVFDRKFNLMILGIIFCFDRIFVHTRWVCHTGWTCHTGSACKAGSAYKTEWANKKGWACEKGWKCKTGGESMTQDVMVCKIIAIFARCTRYARYARYAK